MPVSPDLTLWQELVNQAHAYQQANQAFFQNCQDRLAIIKKALHHPTQRKVALDFCCYLTLEERQSLLDDLVELASVGHSDIEQVRQIILSLPQNWLLNNIENSANQVLEKATDEEYRRLLELYVKIHISGQWEVLEACKWRKENRTSDTKECRYVRNWLI
jgi:aminoglycoside phosphotransferase family enzyme